MTGIRVVYRAQAVVPTKGAPAVLAHADLSRGYFPRRGILFSLLIHEIAFIGMLYLPESGKLTPWSRAQKTVTVIHRSEPMEVVWLPMLGGGDPALDLPEIGLEARHSEPSLTAAPGTEGLSYPGPQPILSNLPDPTNFIQTVLRPALENPPILVPPVLLPNLVLMADAVPAPQAEPPPPPVKPPDDAKPVERQPEAKVVTRVGTPEPLVMPKPSDAPKLVLPAGVSLNALVPGPIIPEPIVTPPPADRPSIPQDAGAAKPLPKPVAQPKMEPPEPVIAPPAPKDPPMPKDTPSAKPLPKPVAQPKIEPPEPVISAPAPKDPPMPKDTPSAKPLPKPEAEPPARTLAGLKEPAKLELPPRPARGTDPLNLVALTPMPVQPKPPFEVPSGEARGSFAISPKPNLAASGTTPGLKLETPSVAAGTGRPTAAPAEKETVGTPPPVASAGTTERADAAKGKNASSAGAGVEKAPRTGAASPPGLVIVGGSGKASGSGSGAFAGITIVGGVKETGTAANPGLHAPAPRPLQTAYGVTVISTESSGGGLPPLGVFSQEQVYTVYLDMRQTEVDPDPSWTLEFAVLQDTAAQADAVKSPDRSQQGLILPFPAVKERPVLPAELVRKYLGKLIIVFAVVNIEGKMEQLSVKESPDTLFNEPVLHALSKWLFRPARLGGEVVRVKVLLGIPLWLPE